MDGGVGDPLRQSRQHPGNDHQGGVGLGQQGSDQGQYGRDGDPEQEDSLPAVLGGEVPARDLGEDVAVEEAGEDQALRVGVPVKIRILKQFITLEESIHLFFCHLVL